MTTPTQPTSKPACLSFAEATVVLDNPTVRRAYLVDAVTVGLHMVNEAQERDYPDMLRSLMTFITDDQVYFGLFEGKTRVAMLSYTFQPDMGFPMLEETDSQRRPQGPSEWTRMLQPVFDHVLSNLEKQIWDRVLF